MYIQKVSLTNFRNYEHCEITLAPFLNVFKGNNAQGKTNFLESIYLASIGKSPKTTKDKDLIKWKEKNARISVTVKKQFFEEKIELYLRSEGKKSIKINDVIIRKIGDLIGEIPVVYFAPDEIGLIKEGPADRRRFMDIDISQLNRSYFYLLCRYEKLLQERNKLLKQTKNFESLHNTIDLWDTQMCDVASKIIFYRLEFIEKIKIPAKDVHFNITSGQENLSIKYQGINLKTVDEIKQKLFEGYKKNLKKDFDFGFTTIGPHRDDIEIEINNIDIRNFGSQGQQRLATLSLKVAELDLFEKTLKEKPILLLDDVLSELDAKRCKNFLEQIRNYQTILTTTKFSRKIGKEDAVFVVKNANIQRM